MPHPTLGSFLRTTERLILSLYSGTLDVSANYPLKSSAQPAFLRVKGPKFFLCKINAISTEIPNVSSPWGLGLRFSLYNVFCHKEVSGPFGVRNPMWDWYLCIYILYTPWRISHENGKNPPCISTIAKGECIHPSFVYQPCPVTTTRSRTSTTPPESQIAFFRIGDVIHVDILAEKCQVPMRTCLLTVLNCWGKMVRKLKSSISSELMYWLMTRLCAAHF